jgi:hypothetical protein
MGGRWNATDECRRQSGVCLRHIKPSYYYKVWLDTVPTAPKVGPSWLTRATRQLYSMEYSTRIVAKKRGLHARGGVMVLMFVDYRSVRRTTSIFFLSEWQGANLYSCTITVFNLEYYLYLNSRSLTATRSSIHFCIDSPDLPARVNPTLLSYHRSIFGITVLQYLIEQH